MMFKSKMLEMILSYRKRLFSIQNQENKWTNNFTKEIFYPIILKIIEFILM